VEVSAKRCFFHFPRQQPAMVVSKQPARLGASRASGVFPTSERPNPELRAPLPPGTRGAHASPASNDVKEQKTNIHDPPGTGKPLSPARRSSDARPPALGEPFFDLDWKVRRDEAEPQRDALREGRAGQKAPVSAKLGGASLSMGTGCPDRGDIPGTSFLPSHGSVRFSAFRVECCGNQSQLTGCYAGFGVPPNTAMNFNLH
jgi:hypothetical protein